MTALERLLRPLYTRLRLLFGRAVIRLVDDALATQNLQLAALRGETLDEVERFVEYGLISVPLPGAEVAFGSIGGKRDHAVVVAVTDKRTRPTGGTPGDSGVYHYEGHELRLSEGGRAILRCKTLEVIAEEQVDFKTPLVTFSKDIKIEGNSTATDHLSSGKSGKGHTHTGDNGGKTSSPL